MFSIKTARPSFQATARYSTISGISGNKFTARPHFYRGSGNLFYRVAQKLKPKSKATLFALASAGTAIWMGILLQNVASQKRNSQLFKSVLATLQLDPTLLAYLNTPNSGEVPFVKVENLLGGWIPLELPMGSINMIKGTADVRFNVVGSNPDRKARVQVKGYRLGGSTRDPWEMSTFRVIVDAANLPAEIRDQCEPILSESVSIYKPAAFILKDFAKGAKEI